MIMAGPPGRNRLLNAAERLFAVQGIDATSARAINAAAGLSSAALHYHFGNKDAVVREVLRRRMDALNQQRAEMIAANAGNAATLDALGLAELIVHPLANFVVDDESAGRTYIRFLARVYAEQAALMHEFVEDHFSDGVAVFDEMILRAAPHLDVEEAGRRRWLAGQAATQGLALMFSGGDDEVDEAQIEKGVKSLTAFVAGGLVAPLVS